MHHSFPVLYSFRRCPYAIRTRMALYYAGIQCEIREIKLSHKPPQMLEISPKGTVPVLVLPCGTVIDESLNIMQWAVTQNNPNKWLCDKNDALIIRNDTVFKQSLDRYKYPSRYPNDNYLEAQKIALEILCDIDARLKHNSRTLGDNMQFTQIAIFPFIRQFASVDKAWFATLPLNFLHQWLDTYLMNPLFLNAMQKYNIWQSSDVPVFFLK